MHANTCFGAQHSNLRHPLRQMIQSLVEMMPTKCHRCRTNEWVIVSKDDGG